MKFTIILALLLSPHAFAQGFIISDSLYTETESDTYDFHMDGKAFFSDSMLIVYSIKTADSIPDLLLTDMVDFTADSVVYPEGFSYSNIDSTLHIDLGNYPTKEVIVEITSSVSGEKREHIYIHIPNLESYIEDEE